MEDFAARENIHMYYLSRKRLDMSRFPKVISIMQVRDRLGFNKEVSRVPPFWKILVKPDKNQNNHFMFYKNNA